MTDERDPRLQTLFAEAQHDLEGEEFAAKVMAQTRHLRYRLVAGLFCLAFLLAAGAWYFAIPLQVAQLITQVLTTTLIDLGESWLAWVLSPVNNIASLLIVSVKAMRVLRKRMLSASYAN